MTSDTPISGENAAGIIEFFMSTSSESEFDEANLRATNAAMLAIKSLDPQATLSFSEFTGKWYVEARIEISDGMMLRGGTEHRAHPEGAVLAYLRSLQHITLDEVIVAKPTGQRRHYRWNGAAFAEQYDSRPATPTPDRPIERCTADGCDQPATGPLCAEHVVAMARVGRPQEASDG